jgi:transcriptional repressor NrdR
MEGLKALDDVAYVRFASVYRNFREARDFEELLGQLSSDEGEGEAAPVGEGARPRDDV